MVNAVLSARVHCTAGPVAQGIGGTRAAMKLYSAHGANDFVICCGYKGYVIKEYFANYFLHMSDVTFDMADNSVVVHQQKAEPWRVTLVDTGENTSTGGRLKRVANYIKDEPAFCFTYGDGLSNLNIRSAIEYHGIQNFFRCA